MKTQLICLFVLLAISVFGQINKYGNPLYKNYDALSYNAAVQNWAVVQDHRGVMYFGNNDDGILEYDGKEWRKIPVSNKSIIWALEVDEKGNVFVGAVDEFGYLAPDEKGKMIYNSLINDLDSLDREFGNIYRIYVQGGEVYFCSVKSIFKYDYNEVEKLVGLPKSSFLSFFMDGNIYVGNYAEGLTEFSEKDTFIVSAGGDFFKMRNIISMHKYDKENILIGTMYNGLFLYNPNTGNINDSIFPFEIQELIKQYGIYSVKCLEQNDQYVLATLDKGAVIINKEGEILTDYNTLNGLPDDRMYYAYNSSNSESQRPIWYALDKGISKQYHNSPITYFGESDGIKGAVIAIARYKGVLYVATAYGVFYQSFVNNRPVFCQIEEIPEPWELYTATYSDGTSKLMVGTVKGLYEISDTDRVDLIETKIVNLDHPEMRFYIYTLCQSDDDPDVLYLGTSNGVLVLRYSKDNDRWKIEYNIEEISDAVRRLAFDKNDNLWAATGYDGVLKITFRAGEYSIKSYSKEDGLPSNKGNLVYNFKEKLFFATEEGVYRFDEVKQQFAPDTNFGESYLKGEKRIQMVTMDIHGNYWMGLANDDPKFSKRWMEIVSPVKEDYYKIFDAPFKFLPNLVTEAIYNDENNITWLGNSNGLYCYNANFNRKYNDSFYTLIRSVKLNDDSIIFKGTYFEMDEDSNIVVSLTQPAELIPEIDYKYRNLKFSFAAPYFDEEEAMEFMVFLEGYDNAWSKWDKKAEAVYTNLDEGDYVFKVKARNIYGTESEIASYAFSIEPPWYRTVIAYILYVVVGGFILWLIITLYTRKLKRDKIRLEKIVEERTQEIREQKDEIEEQKNKIEEINEELTDSIKYAERIQGAILPHKEYAESVLDDYFILFKPKDIVSGDFYWLTKIDQFTIITAADCTGHGVPGAFMSMLGVAFLNEIVKNKSVRSTGQVLDHLRDHVIKSLQQTGKTGEQKDGMDLALCAIDSENNSLQFSGANNPLYLIRNKSYGDKLTVKSGEQTDVLEPAIDMDDYNLFEVKGDKMPVAIHVIMDSFQSFEIDLKKDDTIYMFSDGFADQFGGKKGKKFMYKPFKKLLLGMQDVPMADQKITLNDAIEEWKAFPNPYTGEAFEQIDDIVVVGVRIV